MKQLVIEFAKALDGRGCGHEVTLDEIAIARKSGIVIVYGASDDLMEFEGAINDEVGCYNGGTAYITPKGILENKCSEDDCPYFEKEKQAAVTIEAIWATQGYSWIFSTTIPHETFNIMEDGDTYCRGIVFSIKDV